MILGLEFAGGLVVEVDPVMEASAGEWPTQAHVENRNRTPKYALGSALVGVLAAIVLEKPVTFQFPQVVAELIQTVGIASGRCRPSGFGVRSSLLDSASRLSMTRRFSGSTFI